MNDIDKVFAAQERFFSSSYDKARAYGQVVSGIGYAGIFASWTFTKPFLTKGEVFWSALLAAISIMAFVLFEVFSAFMTSRAILGLAKSVEKKAGFLEAVQNLENDEKRLKIVYAKIWSWVWVLSFSTGIASACILLGAFVGHLIGGY